MSDYGDRRLTPNLATVPAATDVAVRRVHAGAD